MPRSDQNAAAACFEVNDEGHWGFVWGSQRMKANGGQRLTCCSHNSLRNP